jgi:hypothetical protein
MKTLSHSVELARRCAPSYLACNAAPRLKRPTLEMQIAEFEQRGGTAKIIPFGVGTIRDGKPPINETPGTSMAISRPNKKQKPAIDYTEKGKYINQKNAAKLLGKDTKTLHEHIKNKKINLNIRFKQSGSNYYLTADVLALKKPE